METDNPFEKVLDRLREKGWRKYSIGPEEGPNCLNGGAFYEGVLTRDEFQRITCQVAIEHYRDRVLEESKSGLNTETDRMMAGMYFNNHPDTTFTDVERVLEKAAVKWEEERVLRHD